MTERRPDALRSDVLLMVSVDPNYGLFAGWMRRNGKPTLRHVVVEPDHPSDAMVTVCGRDVPDDAHLEALRVKQAHDFSVYDRCNRCAVTRLACAQIGTREVTFRCYPTDCMLCQERVLDPGRGKWINPG